MKSKISLLLITIFLVATISAYALQTTYNPFTGKLDYIQTENFTGHNLTADYFIGDGSGLTNVGIGDEGDPLWTSNKSFVAFLNQSNLGNINVSSIFDICITGGNCLSKALIGNIFDQDLNTTSNVSFDYINVTGNINVTDNVTAEYFIGDGSQLTNIQIINDTYATFQTNLSSVDCGAGFLVIGVQSNGTVLCAEDQVGSPGSGDIESVQADNSYVYNGSNSGAVVLAFNETKLNQTVNSSIDLRVNSVFLQAILDSVYHPLWDYDYGDLINTPTIPTIWDAAFNATGDSRWVQISNLVSLVGNWSDDKGDYSTTSQADALYAGIEWDYNQTIPANAYTDTGLAAQDACSEITGCVESAITELSEDSSPQLGGYLDTNNQNIGSTSDEIENVYVATNSRIYFGNGQETSIYYNGTVLIIG